MPNKPKEIAVTLLAGELAGLPTVPAHPGNIQQALAIQYAVPNVRATAHWLAETPLRPSWIRTPGRMQNTFGNESFIDELAAAAGADPSNIANDCSRTRVESSALSDARCSRTGRRKTGSRLAKRRDSARTRVLLHQVRTDSDLRGRGGGRRGSARGTGKVRVERCSRGARLRGRSSIPTASGTRSRVTWYRR